jgi:hypothetical protein
MHDEDFADAMRTGHPVRLILRILAERAHNDCCCTDDRVPVAGVSTVSQHIKVLVDAGLSSAA